MKDGDYIIFWILCLIILAQSIGWMITVYQVAKLGWSA